MASGAPDYERIVTVEAEVEMGTGAPDWERIVVGAGGTPLTSQLYVNGGQFFDPTTIAAGASHTFNFGTIFGPGSDCLLIQTLNYLVATAGDYFITAYYNLSGDGVLLGTISTQALVLPAMVTGQSNSLILIDGLRFPDLTTTITYTIANGAGSAGSLAMFPDSPQSCYLVAQV